MWGHFSVAYLTYYVVYSVAYLTYLTAVVMGGGEDTLFTLTMFSYDNFCKFTNC